MNKSNWVKLPPASEEAMRKFYPETFERCPEFYKIFVEAWELANNEEQKRQEKKCQ